MPQNILVGGGGGGLPTPDKARFALWQAVTDPTASSSGWTTVLDNIQTNDSGAIEGGYNAPSLSNGPGWTIFVEGGGSGHSTRTYSGEPFIFPGRFTIMKGTILFAVSNIAAQGDYYVGLSSVVNADDPLTGDSVLVGYKKVTGVGLGNWQFFVVQGGNVTQIDTGVPVVGDVRFTFTIQLQEGFASLQINGKSVAVSNINFPILPLGLLWYLVGSDTGAGGANGSIFEYMYAQNSTP